MKIQLVLILSGLMLVTSGFSQQPEPVRLLFREDWNELPPYDLTTPYSLTQADVMNPDLIQTLYGPARDSIKKRHHGTPQDAYYVFTGFCESLWALVIAGDSIATKDFWDERRAYYNVQDEEELRKSMEKIDKIADIIVPGHDNVFFNI